MNGERSIFFKDGSWRAVKFIKIEYARDIWNVASKILLERICRYRSNLPNQWIPTMQNRLGKSSQQENFHRIEFFRRIRHKIYMCRLWQVPANLNCSVPRSVGSTGILEYDQFPCWEIFKLKVINQHAKPKSKQFVIISGY